jgi:hypothetical protein
LLVCGEGFDALAAERLVWPLDRVIECMCRRDMIRLVSRAGLWEGLLGGSVLGVMSEVMLVWVRVWVCSRSS